MIEELTKEERELIKNYRSAKPLHQEMAREILEWSVIQKNKEEKNRCKVVMFKSTSVAQ